jgi:hypothetical protein
MLKRLHEAVRRKRPQLQPSDWVLYDDSAPAHKALSLPLSETVSGLKSITEMEHPSCSPDLAPDDFWLFPKIKSGNSQKIKYDDGTESYSITGVPEILTTVAASLG